MIPFNVPFVPEVSKQYVLEALESNHQQGDGPFTAKASKMVSDLVGGGHVLLTPSCTHALELASMLANIGPGDEVILPSYTFTSAATAITKFGATPVFVDIEMDKKGIDVNHVREAISPRTKAISWVNYAGVAPDIEALQSLAREFDLLLIEDNAHGLGGSHAKRPLGSFGDFATQSFHATKNVQCGEGGALIINNPNFIDRAEIIREKGTDRSKFLRGDVQKYQWVDHGSSYLLSEIQAAQLLGSLENFDFIQTSRRKIWNSYSESLPEIVTKLNLDRGSHVAHMFYLLAKDYENQKRVMKLLQDNQISAIPHYQPLHNSIAGLRYGKTVSEPRNSICLSQRIVRIPLWTSLDEAQIDFICRHLSVLRDYLGASNHAII